MWVNEALTQVNWLGQDGRSWDIRSRDVRSREVGGLVAHVSTAGVFHVEAEQSRRRCGFLWYRLDMSTPDGSENVNEVVHTLVRQAMAGGSEHAMAGGGE